jgi:tyrosine-protein phosphatase SIW14
MPRILRIVFVALIVGLLVGGPVAYLSYRQKQVRSFRVVRDGVLYRSGQMTLAGLRRVIHDYGIKTVVTLRDAYVPGNRPPDWAEEQYCRSEDISYCRITPRPWWASDDSVPAELGVRQFRAVMDDPKNYPVLVHCCAGIHRTGAYCAIYRMEYQHWTNQRALAEMRSCGYTNLDEEWDILSYLEQYRPRWKEGDRADSGTSSGSPYRVTARPSPRKGATRNGGKKKKS